MTAPTAPDDAEARGLARLLTPEGRHLLDALPPYDASASLALNKSLRGELEAAGMTFNEVDPAPFEARLREAGFYAEWKGKYGDEAWAILERSVGRALACQPQLLILDEPTTGMDVNARRAFWERMRDQATRGRTIIFATHYLEEAQDFAQRIILIGRGQLVADGPTSEIRAITNGRTVQATFAGVSTEAHLGSDERLASLSRRDDVTQTEISGGRVSFVSAQSDDLARAVLDAGGTDLTITEPSLENVFVQLTSTPRQEKQS